MKNYCCFIVFPAIDWMVNEKSQVIHRKTDFLISLIQKSANQIHAKMTSTCPFTTRITLAVTATMTQLDARYLSNKSRANWVSFCCLWSPPPDLHSPAERWMKKLHRVWDSVRCSVTAFSWFFLLSINKAKERFKEIENRLSTHQLLGGTWDAHWLKGKCFARLIPRTKRKI